MGIGELGVGELGVVELGIVELGTINPGLSIKREGNSNSKKSSSRKSLLRKFSSRDIESLYSYTSFYRSSTTILIQLYGFSSKSTSYSKFNVLNLISCTRYINFLWELLGGQCHFFAGAVSLPPQRFHPGMVRGAVSYISLTLQNVKFK